MHFKICIFQCRKIAVAHQSSVESACSLHYPAAAMGSSTAVCYQRQCSFSHVILQWIFDISSLVLHPVVLCITGAMGPFLPITPELEQPLTLMFRKVVLVPVYIVATLMLSLPALAVFSVRMILFKFKQSYCISHNVHRQSSLSSDKPTLQAENDSRYTVATANLCLLPEIMAQFNNLNNSVYRARNIGERIYVDQAHHVDMMKNQLNNSCNVKHCVASNGTAQLNGYHSSNTQTSTSTKSNNLTSAPKVDVLTHFPQVDFFCMQEAFDRHYTEILRSELAKVYPYIVHDVGYTGPFTNGCGLNSGLLLASRYKVLDVRFKLFSKKCGFSHIIGKGLMMAKVCLEECSDGKRKVGYIYNTHLQAFQGNNPVVQAQLSEMENWTSEFREDTLDTGDQVILDVLCGDFNIDNMSPGEAHLTRHSFFDVYVDVCREKPGKDFDWTYGTELRTPMLHDDGISTPERLKQVLEDPVLRQQYIIDADLQEATMESIYNAPVKKDAHGNIILSPVGGRRRIDVVLHRKDCPMEVQNYNVVTRLAPLTDHVPVSLTFKCQQ